MTIYSSPAELVTITGILTNLMRLPYMGEGIPGNILESVIAEVRSGIVLNTYDFVDVIENTSDCGWQVKSTKAQTPVTWKRAKLPDANPLIQASHRSSSALQELGDSIIRFCNEHAHASLERYGIEEIGYARLILHSSSQATYFERLLCSTTDTDIFNPADYSWQWSTAARKGKKEQLPALHGINRSSGKRSWAWHGLGENQLHFTGESDWWPAEDDTHRIDFGLPRDSAKLSLEQLMALLASSDTNL